MTHQPTPSQRQIRNLPPQLTSFIGRAAEVAEIAGLLATPTCRLLSLVGLGGVGKTRLAIQAAARTPDQFKHGVYFIPLQSILSLAPLISAIAAGVGFSLSGQDNPEEQLRRYLLDKEMLLLLDNFEQLLAEGGATLLTNILAAAPAVKFLVTSREALNLQEEWRYPVYGLPAPKNIQTDAVEEYEAVQLFVERARRMYREFSLEDEQAGAARICQLVEGMPLAIELAAAWTGTLSCAAIAAEIQGRLDFLTTSLRNVPDRRRSIQAVFDRSWSRLTETERDVFKRLSVFRGGFQQEAARQVAGATLSILAALVDKCLLRRDSDGRYQIHELLRQFAANRLQTTPEAVDHTREAHCAYYAAFLDHRRTAIDGDRQLEVAFEIGTELENIRAAWQWALDRTKIEEIQKSAHAFVVYCHFQSRYLEAANIFEQAVNCLSALEPTGQTGLTLADALVRLGWFCIRLGRFDRAAAVLEQSRALYTTLEAAPMSAQGTDPLPALAILALVQGNAAEAVALGQQARQASEARADRYNLTFAYYVLTSAMQATGNYETARRYAQQACLLAEATHNRWFLAYCLNEWGNVARALGDYDEAQQHYRTSYAIRKAFDDPEGMAVALNHLGGIALLQGDETAAQQFYGQSLDIYRKINDSGGLAASLNGLGQAACAQGDYQTARRRLSEALKIAVDIQFLPLACSILIGLADLFRQTGSPERGLELLALIRDHPAGDQETKERVRQALAQSEAGFEPDRWAAAIRRGQNSDLDAVVAGLLTELASLQASALPEEASPPAADPPPSPHPLIDPLTGRELEILRLIATGRSNREIGEELTLELGTVKWYASQIYSKLNVKNRTEAAARGRELNLLGDD